jgi:hypothetical protein
VIILCPNGNVGIVVDGLREAREIFGTDIEHRDPLGLCGGKPAVLS